MVWPCCHTMSATIRRPCRRALAASAPAGLLVLGIDAMAGAMSGPEGWRVVGAGKVTSLSGRLVREIRRRRGSACRRGRWGWGWRRRADSNRRIEVLQTSALGHLATSPRWVRIYSKPSVCLPTTCGKPRRLTYPAWFPGRGSWPRSGEVWRSLPGQGGSSVGRTGLPARRSLRPMT